MKINNLIFFILFFLSLYPHQIVIGQSSRIKHSINDNWDFYLNKNESEISSLASAQKQKINLPHTWNLEDAFDKAQKYFQGVGLYEKKIVIPSNNKSKRTFIYFEGVNQVCEVWLNGNYLGKHIGGYTAFTFELTDFIRFDTENLLFIKVNNKHNDDIPPLDADFTFYGGIYRDVYLIQTSDIHFNVLDYASSGVYITPKINNDQGEIYIQSNLVNDGDKDSEVKVVHNVYDNENELLKSCSENYLLKKNTVKIVDCSIRKIENLKLWSPEFPNLYSIKSDIYKNNILVDNITISVGFRKFKYDIKSGLLLNGEPIKLIGANRHQDKQGRGNALSELEHIKDLEIIKEHGFNFLRLAHYPQDPVVLQTADKIGLVIWEEIPIVNTITMNDAFTNSCIQMLTEMIKQHYNHPSIFMWGYMNEILLRKPDPLPKDYINNVYKLAAQLEKLLKELDPNRFSVMAQSYEEIDDGTGIGDITDLIGFNLYFGWYYDEFDHFSTYLDTFHSKYPNKPIIISEYGAGSDERVHTIKPVRFDFSNEYQQRYHESQFRQIKNNDYLVGSAIWNMFDFGSNFRNDTKFGINQKGIYYYDRTPKDVSYFYKANLISEPFVHIASRDYEVRSINHDRIEEIKIYSNLDSVSLKINDKYFSTKGTKNGIATWNVQLYEGKNKVLANGANEYKNIIDQFEIFGEYNETNFNKCSYFSVNVGSDYNFVDQDGVIWHADKEYSPGSWGFVKGKKISTKHRIIGTDDDPVYQTALINFDNYKFSVPGGRYMVRLLLSEISNAELDENNIAVNFGSEKTYRIKLSRDDKYFARQFAFETSTNSEADLTISLESSVNRSILNGIQLIKLN